MKRDGKSTTTRRAVLGGVAAGAAALAGCDGGGDGGGTGDTPTVTAGADTLPSPVAGDPDADVTVKVWEDFACPHCRDYVLNVLPTIRSEYVEPGIIRYEHHDFPIPVDPEVSWNAANAARAVQDTVGDDAFYDYATLLYENSGSLDDEQYATLAEQVDAEPAPVRSAAEDRTYQSTLRADRQAGLDAGVEGTPAVFVNGESVPQTVEEMSAAIDEARS